MKNMNRCYLSMALLSGSLLLASSCASHYEVAGVERSRILVDNRYDAQPDLRAANFIMPYKNKVDSMMTPVVGSTASYMAAYRPESELGNLLADILIWSAKDFEEKPVFAVYNVGGIRAAFAKGDVTIGDVLDVAPFENKICFLTLTGDKVLQLFQQIAHRGGEAVSRAVRMVITKDGKLVEATLDGKPIEPTASYRIATLDYLAEGNDEMTAFKYGTDVFSPKQRENNVRYLIRNFFLENKAQGKAVESHIEGRIVVR